MTIKQTVISTSIALTLGITGPLFAQTATDPSKIVDGDAVTIECIPQAEVDAMSQEDKEKLTLPICELVDGEMKKEDSMAVTQ